MLADGDMKTRWSSKFSDNQWFRFDMEETLKFDTITIDWEKAFAASYLFEISEDGEHWSTIYQTNAGNGGTDLLYVGPQETRHIRWTGLKRGTAFGYSIWEIGFWNGNPVRASSSQSESTGPEKVIDGNSASRWSSDFLDHQWILIDYKKPVAFNTVSLLWENAYAQEYEIRVSSDGIIWETIYATKNGEGGHEVINTGQCVARYLKISCRKRATEYGFSIHEIDIGLREKP